MFKAGDGLFVGVEGFGAYTFHGYTHRAYVREKLGLPQWEAQNLADFINAQLGWSGEQGEYLAGFCKLPPGT
jgi:hypothetical protein